MPRSNVFRIAFIPTANAGVNYYRMAAWVKEMRKYRNVEVALYGFDWNMIEPHPWQIEFAGSFDIRQRIESLHKAADLVIWQPVHYPHTFEFFSELRQKYGKTTLIDMDDNYLDLPPWNEAHRSFGPNSGHRQIALETLVMADGVIVTTPHLKDVYKRYNDNIHVVENSLDFKGSSHFVGWDQVSVRRHKGIRIGWIGGRCHFDDLMMVAPVLVKVLRRHPDVTLCLVNSALKESCKALNMDYPFEGISNVHYVDRSVSINRYAQFMSSFGFDIGIAPLVDCNFNRSKSNLRWLEYSALKIPSIASDISHFSSTIRHEGDGYLVKGNDLDQWEHWIEFSIAEAVLRDFTGRTAYRRVKDDFNVKKNAPKYFRLLKKFSEVGTYQEEPEVTKELAEVA